MNFRASAAAPGRAGLESVEQAPPRHGGGYLQPAAGSIRPERKRREVTVRKDKPPTAGHEQDTERADELAGRSGLVHRRVCAGGHLGGAGAGRIA